MRGARRSHRAGLALTLAVGGMLLLVPAGAHANTFAPPNHKIFHGVSETGDVADFRSFNTATRAHSAVSQSFFHWGVPLSTGALQRWRRTKTRGVLSLSTAPGGQPEKITPKAVAKGRGDNFMLRLNASISGSRQTVYIRLFPEMNGHWNPYSAFNANGSSRGADHSTRWFRKAWQRFAIVIRGGSRRTINTKLRKLKLPRLLRARSNNGPIYKHYGVGRRLPKPRVALMWVPQTSGSPNVRGNRPAKYYPGNRYVDWVGAFTDRMFDWVRSHGRARMLIYYRSVNATNIFNINFYPGARSVVRQALNGSRFMPFAPEYTP